jgi:tetratricopeptide (TPR) repeat protein
MGAPRALALCLNFGGALEFQAGRWGEAEEGLRSAVDLYRQVGSAAGESLSLQRLGVLLTAKGEVDEALSALTDGLVVAERAAMRSHCLTRLHASIIRNRLAARDAEGIRSSLDDGLEAIRRHGKCVTCNALLLPEVIRALIELGDLERATESLEKLQGIAERFDSHVWTAMACQAKGRVCMAKGCHEDAAKCFERAAQDFQAVEQPYEAARSMFLQAKATRLANGESADDLEKRAKEMFAKLGAPGIED